MESPSTSLYTRFSRVANEQSKKVFPKYTCSPPTMAALVSYVTWKSSTPSLSLKADSTSLFCSASRVEAEITLTDSSFDNRLIKVSKRVMIWGKFVNCRFRIITSRNLLVIGSKSLWTAERTVLCSSRLIEVFSMNSFRFVLWVIRSQISVGDY